MTKPTTLLIVTGLTPQVVTETLYALHRQNAVMPSSIHILTTAEGAERAKLTLINDGWLARFYQDYALPLPEFTERHIHTLTSNTGEALQDIRTQADNQAMADAITEWIRQLTLDNDTALQVSIAGGRKTMGFYAGYALSLYARPGDKLSHVLISADYESHPQFYYPTPYSQVIYGNDPTHKPLDTQLAEVMLADIPFVRLRHGLDKALLEGKSSFSESVQQIQQSMGEPELKFNLHSRQLIAQGQVIRLAPAEFAFYYWLLVCQFKSQSAPTCPCEGAPENSYACQYLKIYQRLLGDMPSTDRTLKTLEKGMTKTFSEQRKSRVNKVLKEQLKQAAAPYLIGTQGKRPTRHVVGLNEKQISIE